MSSVAAVTIGEREPVDQIDIWSAVHEAGHALAVVRLGFELGAVTIREPFVDGGPNGMCYSRYQVPPVPSLDQCASVLLWDWRTREHFERRYAVVIAGDVAVELCAPRADPGYRPEPVTERERATIIEQLEAAGFGRLVTGVAAPPDELLETVSDDEKALRLARLGVTDESLEAAYVHWLTSAVVAWCPA